jgi:hypothetical protein
MPDRVSQPLHPPDLRGVGAVPPFPRQDGHVVISPDDGVHRERPFALRHDRHHDGPLRLCIFHGRYWGARNIWCILGWAHCPPRGMSGDCVGGEAG